MTAGPHGTFANPQLGLISFTPPVTSSMRPINCDTKMALNYMMVLVGSCQSVVTVQELLSGAPASTKRACQAGWFGQARPMRTPVGRDKCYAAQSADVIRVSPVCLSRRCFSCAN